MTVLTLAVPRDVLAKDKQVLVLHGVDTVAEVLLNGHVLGTTDNMFVRYRFDVKGVLKVRGGTPFPYRLHEC